MFKALMLDRTDSGLQPVVRTLDDSALPPRDTTIRVEYSSLNYKDGLAITGKGKIIRGDFPFVPGIDLAGVVESSDRFPAGTRVLVTGWQIGEKHWGGHAQKARVRADWAIPIPDALSTRDAMLLGTAGLTAALAVDLLEKQGAKPDGGEIVVTGATGGVGSIAIALLAKRGFAVVASTGSHDRHDWLKRVGASRIIDRSELPSAASNPMGKALWAGAVDNVGGDTLAGILAQLSPHAAVAACGNASGFELHTTVFPFILRGISLLGVDSNTAPNDLRGAMWNRLARDVTPEILQTIDAGAVSLEELPQKAEEITEGRIDGRIVVDVNR